MKNNTVLVTDGRSRASLAIIRSLGKMGIRIISGESFRCSSFYSRYTRRRILYPDPDNEPELFMQKIHEIINEEDVNMIFPVRDSATLLLSKYRDKFPSSVDIPLADYDILIKGRNKEQTIKIAMQNEIPCPKTYFVNNENEIKEVSESLSFPVLIKPCESSGSRGIKYVNSEEELLNSYKHVKSEYGVSMIQEFIPHGGAYGVETLFNKGEPRAVFVHKRLREYPRSGGPSTLRESVKYPEIEKYAIKLLKALNWHGVAMVEFRIDSRDGRPKLMEINPRFWGSLPLALHSGVDFPYLLYKMVSEGDVEPVFDYKIGVKTRWFLFGDVLWFLSSPSKLRALPEFLSFRGVKYDVLSLGDPMPVFGALLDGARSMGLKERRSHAFDRGW